MYGGLVGPGKLAVHVHVRQVGQVFPHLGDLVFGDLLVTVKVGIVDVVDVIFFSTDERERADDGIHRFYVQVIIFTVVVHVEVRIETFLQEQRVDIAYDPVTVNVHVQAHRKLAAFLADLIRCYGVNLFLSFHADVIGLRRDDL